MVNAAYFDLIGHLSHFDIDECSLRLWSEAPMWSDHAHICRLAQVNANTLIVFIAPKRLYDYWDAITSKCTSACSFPYCSRASDYPSVCHCWHVCRRLLTPGLVCQNTSHNHSVLCGLLCFYRWTVIVLHMQHMQSWEGYF